MHQRSGFGTGDRVGQGYHQVGQHGDAPVLPTPPAQFAPVQRCRAYLAGGRPARAPACAGIPGGALERLLHRGDVIGPRGPGRLNQHARQRKQLCRQLTQPQSVDGGGAPGNARHGVETSAVLSRARPGMDQRV